MILELFSSESPDSIPHHNILDLSYISSYNQLSYVLYRHHNILYPIIYPSFLLKPRPLCPNLSNPSCCSSKIPRGFCVFCSLTNYQTLRFGPKHLRFGPKHWGLDPNIEVWTQTWPSGVGKPSWLSQLVTLFGILNHPTSGEFQVIPFLCPKSFL